MNAPTNTPTQNPSTGLAPFSFQNHSLRVESDEYGNPWFVAADVAEILGYRNAPDMTRRLDDDEKGTRQVRTLGGNQEMTVISESGLYASVLGSHKHDAKPFRKWVTGEVLPSIRKTGVYAAQPTELPNALKQLPDLPAVLTLNAIPVRQDAEGRFCLNDFHKASGGEKRHQPSEWLDTRAARALVNSASKPGFAAAVSKPGHSTHAVKKAALAYAQWVGPEFGAEAARAFGELAKAAKARHGLRQLPEPPLITVAQQGELASLIGRKARNSGKNRVFFLRAVYDQFDLNAYRNVPAGKFDEVMEFLDRLEGDADPLYVFSKPELAALVERKIEEAKAGWTLDRTVSGLRFLLRFEEGGRVAAMAVSPDARVFSPAEYERTLHADGYAIVLQSAVDAIRQIANVNLVA